MDLPQLAHYVRVVLQIGQLALDGLLNVILKRQHVAYVAVYCFTLIAYHGDLARF
jgi:hypothetical protein